MEPSGSSPPRRMALGLFYQSLGHHISAWRSADVRAEDHSSLAHFIDIAQTAERACFDFLFTADTFATFGSDDLDQLARTSLASRHEPITLSGALAAVTRNIGLVLTATTTFYEPMHIARFFASLDQLSGGRSGWNVVTSASQAEAQNFGQDALQDAADRYARAEEFVDVVKALWNSWETDAFLGDKEAGLFLDVAKLHRIDYRSERFRVRGPLAIPRSPQGRPIIVQAGQSGPGRDLAGRTADVVFTVQQQLESARTYYADVRRIAADTGRNPDHIKIMPGAAVLVARSKAEAEDRYAELQRLIPEDVGVRQISAFIGFDLGPYPVDGPLPDIPVAAVAGHGRLIVQEARDHGLTIRQTYERFAGQRGHLTLIGDAASVADALQEWFEGGACDGFNLMPPTFPRDNLAIADLLVPELQRRGLMRLGYEGRTLRTNLGLPEPA